MASAISLDAAKQDPRSMSITSTPASINLRTERIDRRGPMRSEGPDQGEQKRSESKEWDMMIRSMVYDDTEYGI